MALALSGAALASNAQEFRVGVVLSQRIYAEAAPYKAAAAKIDAEFAGRRKALDEQIAKLRALQEKFSRDAATMSDSERAHAMRDISELDRDTARKQREYNEDISQRNNEETQVLGDRTKKVIYQIAAEEKFDVILLDAYYISPRSDITNKVIEALSK